MNQHIDKIYLDHAATTPCDPRVVEAMQPYFSDRYGNASSPYSLGGEAEEAIEGSRKEVAGLIGVSEEEIVFTSGGSESDNTAIKGVAFKLRKQGRHIITSQIEHPAVLESCRWLEQQGWEVTYLPVDQEGLVDPQAVAEAIKSETVLVSIMHANNEVGVIQPIEAIGKITRQRGVYLHSDAVQSIGSVPVDVDKLGVDLLSMSAHKLYGPKGVGALYVRKGTLVDSLIHGGEQERRRRASTENVAGIVGFGRAAELAGERITDERERLISLRDELWRGLIGRLKEVRLNGHLVNRLPNNLNVSVARIEGEGMVLHLDEVGIMCSTGSACSSHNLQPSHVLLAMGLPHELAHGSLRFSLGRSTTKKHVDKVLEHLPPIVEKLRAMSPLISKEKAHA